LFRRPKDPNGPSTRTKKKKKKKKKKAKKRRFTGQLNKQRKKKNNPTKLNLKKKLHGRSQGDTTVTIAISRPMGGSREKEKKPVEKATRKAKQTNTWRQTNARSRVSKKKLLRGAGMFWVERGGP